MTEPQVLSLATLTLITTMQPKGFIDLTEGNFHFSKPVEMAQGVFIRRWGEGDLDRPTIIHYQEGTDPVFPLFRGSEPDGQDMPCPACGHVRRSRRSVE